MGFVHFIHSFEAGYIRVVHAYSLQPGDLDCGPLLSPPISSLNAFYFVVSFVEFACHLHDC